LKDDEDYHHAGADGQGTEACDFHRPGYPSPPGKKIRAHHAMQQQHESQSQVEVHDIVDDRLLLIFGGLGQYGGLKKF
jgi:hypothetical protein